MKALITGASGFVGINLIPYLKSNNIQVSTLSVRYKQNQTILIDNDIDVVIHLAGKAHDTKNTTEEQAYYNSNYELTKQVFDAYLKSKAIKFIFLSSVKAIADSPSEIVNEDTVFNPQTPYGISKKQAGDYILNYKELDKKSYILMPCMIYGKNNKGNLNLLIKLVQKGVPWPLGAFENKRSFLSVENLSFIIKMIIEEDIKSNMFTLSDGESISTNELIKIIGNSLKRKVRILKIPVRFIRFISNIGDILSLPLNNERLKKLTETYEVSNHKILDSLNINELPVKSKVGLLETVKKI